MYDDVAFVIGQENQLEHCYLQNIQSIVEKPYTNWLVKCPSEDHQILYIQEQINDITQLSREIESHRIEITDVMRLFKGNNPAY